jgi:hypothetical protein
MIYHLPDRNSPPATGNDPPCPEMTPATGNDPFVTGNDRASGQCDRAVIIECCQSVENDRFLCFLCSLQRRAVGNNRAVSISLAPSGRK